jgi:hypothetical protein
MSDNEGTPEIPHEMMERSKVWICFHCGEHFGNPYLASAHFGPTSDSRPACVLIQERGMLYELREHERRHSEMLDRAVRAEENVEFLEGELAEFRRIAGGGLHELRMKMDSLQGEAITARVLIEAIRDRAPQIYEEVIR